MTFLDALQAFIQHHLEKRSGNARDRLAGEMGYGERLFLEKVWWPIFSNFRNLHPEYEVRGPGGHQRFVDFAYIAFGIRLAIEVDGYGTHGNRSRWKFTDEVHRSNLLALGGFLVLRFTVDEIQSDAVYCQKVLMEFMGRWGRQDELDALGPQEQVAVRLARRAGRPITPAEVAVAIQASPGFARQLLHALVRDGWLEPARGKQRIRSYRPGSNSVL